MDNFKNVGNRAGRKVSGKLMDEYGYRVESDATPAVRSVSVTGRRVPTEEARFVYFVGGAAGRLVDRHGRRLAGTRNEGILLVGDAFRDGLGHAGPSQAPPVLMAHGTNGADAGWDLREDVSVAEVPLLLDAGFVTAAPPELSATARRVAEATFKVSALWHRRERAARSIIDVTTEVLVAGPEAWRRWLDLGSSDTDDRDVRETVGELDALSGERLDDLYGVVFDATEGLRELLESWGSGSRRFSVDRLLRGAAVVVLAGSSDDDAGLTRVFLSSLVRVLRDKAGTSDTCPLHVVTCRSDTDECRELHRSMCGGSVPPVLSYATASPRLTDALLPGVGTGAGRVPFTTIVVTRLTEAGCSDRAAALADAVPFGNEDPDDWSFRSGDVIVDSLRRRGIPSLVERTGPPPTEPVAPETFTELNFSADEVGCVHIRPTVAAHVRVRFDDENV